MMRDDQNSTELRTPGLPYTDFDRLRGIMIDCANTCQRKDQEYGASWCKRGGTGAFFTVWRKMDRLESQLKERGFNMLDVSDDAMSTESLDETIKDAIAYLGLVLEKREAIRKTRTTGSMNVYTGQPLKIGPEGFDAKHAHLVRGWNPSPSPLQKLMNERHVEYSVPMNQVPPTAEPQLTPYVTVQINPSPEVAPMAEFDYASEIVREDGELLMADQAQPKESEGDFLTRILKETSGDI